MRYGKNKKLRNATRSVLVLLVAAIAAIPLYYVLISSFKISVDMFQHPLSLPTVWQFGNYAEAFSQSTLMLSLLNSLFVTVLGVGIQVFIGSMAAYGVILAKTRLTATLGALLAIAFAIPLQSVLVPQYVIFANLNLTDSLWGLVLLYTGGSLFCYFLIVGYMRALPAELFEAAKMDGAGPLRIYWKIVLPLTQPILTTVVVFQTLYIWNDFLIPNIYLSTPEKQTIPLQVYAAIGQFTTNYPLFMSITVIALVPVFIFFIIAQKWIVSGLLGGAVKG